jgi:hypothetical protein
MNNTNGNLPRSSLTPVTLTMTMTLRIGRAADLNFSFPRVIHDPVDGPGLPDRLKSTTTRLGTRLPRYLVKKRMLLGRLIITTVDYKLAMYQSTTVLGQETNTSGPAVS